MSVIVILILISLTVALLFLIGFIWAVRSGQFEDTVTPSLRILSEEEPANRAANKFNAKQNLTTPP
jgi:cbb3-type cytochrome oxidase maturation protein